MTNSTNILPSFLKVLIYFDVFRYPLTIEEIKTMIPLEEEELLESSLELMVNEKTLFQHENFYGLNEDEKFFISRKEGNTRALKYKERAIKRATFISKFPYVRGVFISGSFSKGHMLPDGDIDFFVITKHNRMWLSRTILILYKKLFLFNSRKFFCLNYFKGDEELSIDEQNVFTATELFTLIPAVNNELFDKLITSNKWIESYYELDKIKKHDTIKFKKRVFQSLIEKLCNNSMGDNLDRFFMRITLKRWKNKFGNMTEEDFTLAMKSSRNISKHHPSNFQKKVLNEYNLKCKNFSKRYVKSNI